MSAFDEIQQMVREDGAAGVRRFPEVTAHILADGRVVEILESRLADGQQLEDIVTLGYSFVTGLQGTVFYFAPVNLTARSILVLTDGDCRVVGLVDPFNPVQPNPKVLPLPGSAPGAVPFALARPGQSGLLMEVPVALHGRGRRFFERLEASQKNMRGTRCVYESGASRWCSVTTPYEDMPDQCDDWDTETRIDDVVDDC